VQTRPPYPPYLKTLHPEVRERDLEVFMKAYEGLAKTSTAGHLWGFFVDVFNFNFQASLGSFILCVSRLTGRGYYQRGGVFDRLGINWKDPC
jgi:hypothetical protein